MFVLFTACHLLTNRSICLFYSQLVTQHVVRVRGRVALSAWRVHTPVTCSTRGGASTRVGPGSFYSRASVLVSMYSARRLVNVDHKLDINAAV